MKKLLGFVIFTALLIWTWNLVHTTSNVGFETHAGIQDKLSDLIQTLVHAKKPEATNIEIKKMSTENIGENRVRALFSYSFSEPQADGEVLEQTIEGEAVLAREASENPNEDRWVLQLVKTTHDAINFTEGTVIGPETEEPAEPAPSATE